MLTEVSYTKMETSDEELMNISAQTTSQLDCKLLKWTSIQESRSLIRPLNPTPEELKTLCRFGKDFADSANAGEFEEKPFLTFINNLLKSKKGEVFMLEKNGNVVGTIGVYAYKVFYNSKLRVQEIFWWVDPEYRNSKDSVKLFNIVEEWAKKVGADEVMVSSTTTMKVDQLERFYAKKGFRRMDITYIRSLKNG